MKLSAMIIFLSIVSTIYFGLHYFVYIHIISGLQPTPNMRWVIRGVFVSGGISFFLGQWLSRRLDHHLTLYLASIWLGIIAIGFSVMIIKQILIFVWPGHNPVFTKVALGLIFCLVVISLINVWRGPKITTHYLPLPKLPDHLNGFKLIQLSDLHLDGLRSKPWLAGIVQQVNSLSPDAIVITGDIVDSQLRHIEDFIPLLRQMQARYGIFAVCGNHEFYAGIQHYIDFLNTTAIHGLDNKCVTIADGLQLAGVPDITGRNWEEAGSGENAILFEGSLGPNLAGALAHVNPHLPLILLCHQPILFEEGVKMGVDLQLSGHTHAGQIPPLDLLVHFRYSYPYGLYQNGPAWIYTTLGTGTWGPPMRLWSRSEIVQFILTKGSSQ